MILRGQELENKVQELQQAISNGAFDGSDKQFALSLCNFYATKGYLSEKQQFYVEKFLKRVAGSDDAGKPHTSGVEEVFSGQIIQSYLRTASKKLKYPKLRYQTDGRFKIVFSYVADRSSKWYDCTFVDNGHKAESKKRYGFIANNGNGRLDRNAPPEVKTLIRKIAEDPAGIAKLQGQTYKNCCFCGLELTNRSSLHHGYGPICAGNYGLPWGDTGNAEEDEKAAVEELKHIQLQDLE
jgi:hypothetical protein